MEVSQSLTGRLDGTERDHLDATLCPYGLREPALLTLAHGRERDATVAEHDRRDPVPTRGGRVGIPRDLRVEVCVHVDEARRDVRAFRVDLLATRIGHRADRRDPVTVDRDVGRQRRGTRAVDHHSGPDDEIVHEAEPKGCAVRR